MKGKVQWLPFHEALLHWAARSLVVHFRCSYLLCMGGVLVLFPDVKMGILERLSDFSK